VTVVSRAYLGLGAFLAVVAAVYWFTSYESAGTTMLVLAAGLALLIGGYLALVVRRRRSGRSPSGQGEDHYLPHASVWPFFAGLAAMVLANGLALGLWALVVGAAGLAAALAGYARQSRRRD
jgi:O-antigen/teichoic acid export membrane protein